MARKQVVEIACDRCARTEYREDDPGHVDHLAFNASMDGMTVQFKDLCTPCLKTVKNHLEAIGKKIDGLSPDRKPIDTPPKDES